MEPLLILRVGSTVPGVLARRGDFDTFFLEGLGVPREAARVVAPHEGQDLPAPDGVGAVVVTGSSAMITDDDPWSLRTQDWLAGAVDAGVAVLGVCYGHQLLAQALGGEAGWNPVGREIGTVEVDLEPEAAGDPLLGGLPPRLRVQASHSQSVLRAPPDALLLARNDHDAAQAFRFGERAWGLQFHPEFDAEIVCGYLEDRRTDLSAEGIDVDARLEAASDSPHGVEILRRFARQAGLAG